MVRTIADLRNLKEMVNVESLIARSARKLYRLVYGIPVIDPNLELDYSGQEASDKIREALLSDKPVMISRLGFVEIDCISRYYFKKQIDNKLIRYIKREIYEYWYDRNTYKIISNNAGVFNPTIEVLDKFSEIYLNDMREIDILGSFTFKERIFKDYLKNAIRIPLGDIEPYYHKYPWSAVLKDKNVLVIHPFAKSIELQYKKHGLLFKDQNVLPDFNLTTIKAVQSIAGNKPEGFSSWFSALDYMKEKITSANFDFAIIGCGAYGLPLAAHVKRLGKKSIHLGGQTQVMFGIRGRRWEDRDFFLNMFNEYWVRPLPEEIPGKYNFVEDGCYW
jgi:hypothetical protein